MTEIIIKARTLATAAVTWFIIGGAVLTAVAQALTTAATDAALEVAWVDTVTQWCTVAAGALITVAAVVRRVTEVIPEHRGLLPVEKPYPAAWPPPV